MKRLTTLFVIFLFAFALPLQAEDSHFHDRELEKNHYSWRPTDESQSRQAVGMFIWGVTFAAGIIIASLLVPNSPAATTTSS